jgi:hypothetical protein
VETMHVDRFCNLATIGTSVKFGKIGLNGRTRRVDKYRRDTQPRDCQGCRTLVGWLQIVIPAFTITAALSEPAHQFSSKDG